ncbi:MAG: SRPBCC family protein [Actinomycetota bacterium]
MSDDILTSGQHSIQIDASPQAIWGLLTDPANQGTLSPECQRAEWEGDITEPVSGAQIHGYNKQGDFEWDAVATVTEADPGRVWEFKVGAIDDNSATTWRYDIAAGDGGAPCTVTESFDAPILREDFFQKMDPPRHSLLMTNLETTLANLKQLAEG